VAVSTLMATVGISLALAWLPVAEL
jgi:hypothetical protein